MVTEAVLPQSGPEEKQKPLASELLWDEGRNTRSFSGKDKI